MWDFDGRTWTAPRVLYGTPEFTAHGPPVAYKVTLEPHSKRWLFALDVPGKVPPRAFASADLQLYSVAAGEHARALRDDLVPRLPLRPRPRTPSRCGARWRCPAGRQPAHDRARRELRAPSTPTTAR